MELLRNILLAVHVFCGFTSLALFFIPAIARKGGRVHNVAGRWYVRGMWGVVITAFLLCLLMSIYFNNIQTGLFLGYLSLITARPLYYGIAVLRHKQGPSARMQRIDLALRIAMGVGGPFLIGAGLGWWPPAGHTLFLIFGILGTVASWPSLLRDLRGKPVAYNWLHEHLGQMVVTAIAAFTAFLAFGGRSLLGSVFEGHLAVVLWTLPTILGLAFSRYYRRRLQRA